MARIYDNRPKFIEQSASRYITGFMIVLSWLSFVVSLWLGMFLSNDFFYFGIFWFVLTVFLAAALGANKPQ